MSKSPETGIAVNIANLIRLIAFLKGYGEAYNPSNNAIAIVQLEKILADAQAAEAAVNAALPIEKAAIHAREVAFVPLSPLATRILNAVVATKTSDQTDNSIKAIVRKIKGQRAVPKKTTEPATDTGDTDTTQISAAQVSYDNQVNNLDKLIQALANIPEYMPNEPELKIETLESLYNDLSAKNKAVTDAHVVVSNARIARNEILYKPHTGLVDTASDVKTYVKSLFGATSPQFRQISGLIFTHK